MLDLADAEAAQEAAMIVLDYYDGPLQGFAHEAFGAD